MYISAEINNLCRCNKSLVEYFQPKIRDLVAKLAGRSIDLDIYDLTARLAAMNLNAAQVPVV